MSSVRFETQPQEVTLTRFNTVSTISLLLTSPTWMRPVRTANFVLIFRIGTEGFITPAGSTTDPEQDIIIIMSPVPEPAASPCCLWPGRGALSPGVATGWTLAMSYQPRCLKTALYHQVPKVFWSNQVRWDIYSHFKGEKISDSDLISTGCAVRVQTHVAGHSIAYTTGLQMLRTLYLSSCFPLWFVFSDVVCEFALPSWVYRSNVSHAGKTPSMCSRLP